MRFFNAFCVLLSTVALAGCELHPFAVPTGSGGSGGDDSTAEPTHWSSTTAAGGVVDLRWRCSPATCPRVSNAECGEAYCDDNDECAYFLYDEEANCGYMGHCNGAGRCIGGEYPTQCTGACSNAGQCSQGYCDTTTGTCKQHFLGNGTTCNNGDGNCNSHDGTCCEGLQVATCPGITDPGVCFDVCIDDPSLCSYACVSVCPFGTLPTQGFCFPVL